jgi:polyisoprenoid-binding protein YceI
VNTSVTFVGSAGPTSHPGSFTRYTGELDVSGKEPRGWRLSFEIEPASVSTTLILLTKHLRGEDFLDVEKYPKATFVSERIEPTTEGGEEYLVTGPFTIHGVTRRLTFPARIVVTQQGVTLDATVSIRQSEFGMAAAARKTKDEVPVTVSARITR